MKATIKTSDFKPIIRALSGMYGKRTTLPILSNVLMSFTESRIDFTATNLDGLASCRMVASVEGEGSITLPASKLFGVLSQMPECDVTLECNDKNVCVITSPNSRYSISGLSIDEWPSRPAMAKPVSFSVSNATLSKVLASISYAVSTDALRYFINGIYLQVDGGRADWTATDGRRLATVATDIDGHIKINCILPREQMAEFRRMLGAGDLAQCKIQVSENRASFDIGGDNQIVFETMLINEHIPNWKQAIPSEVKESVTMPRKELLECVQRAKIMTSETSFAVRLDFTKNNLAITCNNSGDDNAHEAMAVNFKSKPVSVAFSPDYLISLLSNIEADDVIFGIIDELSPLVATVAGADFKAILMPMRLS